MAVPSRVFVGVTVFGLIASLLTVPYTILALTGFRPEALSPVLSFDGAAEPGLMAFLVLASMFSLAVAFVGWRSLVQGARRDARRRDARARLVKEQEAYKRRLRAEAQRPPRPPRGPN